MTLLAPASVCKAHFELGLLLGPQKCRLGCSWCLAVYFPVKAISGSTAFNDPGLLWAAELVILSPVF